MQPVVMKVRTRTSAAAKPKSVDNPPKSKYIGVPISVFVTATGLGGEAAPASGGWSMIKKW